VSAFRTKPAGRDPELNDQAPVPGIAVLPAVLVCSIGVARAPATRVVNGRTVVITGLATTFTVNVSVSVNPFRSVTVSITLKVPGAVGVPEITPVFGSIDKPAGRPVALHAPVAEISAVPLVTVEVMLVLSAV
jgi:hypothetical protein